MRDSSGKEITQKELDELKEVFYPLIGIKIDWLSLPDKALRGFEPSQIAVIVNTLIDGILPQIELLAINEDNKKKLANIGLSKASGILGERESYPDYVHISGKRVELKGLFVNNPELKFKRPPTKREPSARLKENVTMDVIDPKNDVLLIAAVQLREFDGLCSPYIVDLAVLSIVECIKTRDKRLADMGGNGLADCQKSLARRERTNLNKVSDSQMLIMKKTPISEN
jgi:hypothetical protein